MTKYLAPAGAGEPAEQCRRMGIAVGDTIIGRESWGTVGAWHEARLTLLWLGEHVAVWRVQERTDLRREWSEPEEAADWTLDARRWRRVTEKD